MPGFFLVTAGELFFLRLGVRQRVAFCSDLWDTDEESSTTSPLIADRQLWSGLLYRFILSPEESVLSTETQTCTKHNIIMPKNIKFDPTYEFITSFKRC